MYREPAKLNVVPRYTPGSPALVDRETALRVAKEERAAFERVLTGAYGEADKRRAEILGLEGIVYGYTTTRERGNPRVFVRDYITAEDRTWARWEDFGDWSKRNRERTQEVPR